MVSKRTFPRHRGLWAASKPFLRHRFLGWGAAWLVLLASLLSTAVGWHLVRGETVRRAQERFDSRVQRIEAVLNERLLTCEHMLRGGVGFFAASDSVTREEWRTYTKNLWVGQSYSILQGLGFSQRILPAEKEAHLRQIRAEGFPEYTIWPEGERPEYTSVVYLEPFDGRNRQAFGYDMFSEPVRQQAMMRARDTGLAALSGKVTLVMYADQEAPTGFLLYLPVYRRGAAAETPVQRREALAGYVYAAFRMTDFMRGVDEKQGYVELAVFDGDKPLQETLLYQGGTAAGPLAQQDRPPFATRQSILEFGGHRWLLAFVSSRRFDEGVGTEKVHTIAVLGVILSLLLFGMVLSLAKSRGQALVLANMAVDLERTNSQLREEAVERQRAEERVTQLNIDLERHATQVEEANKELEAFSYSVSHDLRAPLRHIQGYGEMLARAAEGQLSDKAQRALKTILDTSGEMGRLIDDLLDFSRMGRAELREDTISLDRLVAETLRDLELTTRGRNMVWKIPPLPTVRGDPSMMKQVFANLLGNAVKYSGPRDPAEIEVGYAGDEDGRLILFVRDNGVGFDMQYAHKLFGVFQRLHRAEEFEGTGIGLASVRRILARHGGRIWAEAALDQGATFYFTLRR